jgi:hypothetical protein
MVCDLCPNIYLDTSSSNSWIRYQPEALDLSQVFRCALNVAGPERLLFGSDSSIFPRGWNNAIFEAQAQAFYTRSAFRAPMPPAFSARIYKHFGPVKRTFFANVHKSSERTVRKRTLQS